MKARKGYLIGGILVAVALGVLLFNAFGKFSVYYYTVGEFKQQQATLGNKEVKIAGLVADAPINWDVTVRQTTFTITDGTQNVPVVYTGPVPDTFGVGADVVVNGRWGQDGVFNASQLVTKCASKYEAALDDRTHPQ